MNYAELLQNADNQHKAEVELKLSEKGIKAELLLKFIKDIFEFMLFIDKSDYRFRGDNKLRFLKIYYYDGKDKEVKNHIRLKNQMVNDINDKLSYTIHVNIRGGSYIHFFLTDMVPMVELSTTCFLSKSDISNIHKEKIHTYRVASEFMEFLALRIAESRE